MLDRVKIVAVYAILAVLLLPCVQAQVRVNVQKDMTIRAGSFFYSVGGVPLATTEYFDIVEGSPFFRDEWLSGMVVLNSERNIKNLSLRIDLVNNNVHYLDQFGVEFIAQSQQLKELVLEDTVAAKNFRFVYSTSLLPEGPAQKGSWLLWLVSGKASLYKKLIKTVFEQRKYGSATLEQRVDTKELYVVSLDGKLIPVKKLKDLPAALPLHKNELAAFIQSDKMAALKNTEDQFAGVIQFYNSIAK
ncbi:MAG: hypothetical protein WKF70_01175 [Chitinophagaceae bacterium]